MRLPAPPLVLRLPFRAIVRSGGRSRKRADEGLVPKQFGPGQAWHDPRGPVHYFRNVGGKPVPMTNILVDKGKPRTVVEPAGTK